MPKVSRNSNIELLRLVLMYFVILLHYNGMGGGVYACKRFFYTKNYFECS